MSDPIPRWAWERADSLVADPGKGFYRTALAKYISEHEQPPVDPLNEAIAAMLHNFCPNDARCYRDDAVRIFRDSLRRSGLTIAKEQSK